MQRVTEGVPRAAQYLGPLIWLKSVNFSKTKVFSILAHSDQTQHDVKGLWAPPFSVVGFEHA